MRACSEMRYPLRERAETVRGVKSFPASRERSARTLSLFEAMSMDSRPKESVTERIDGITSERGGGSAVFSQHTGIFMLVFVELIGAIHDP